MMLRLVRMNSTVMMATKTSRVDSGEGELLPFSPLDVSMQSKKVERAIRVYEYM